VPAAITWKAVAEVLMKGLDFLHPTAKLAVIVGALVGLLVEITKHVTDGRFSLSAVGLGLAFVLPFADIWSMFLGSLIFWLLQRRAAAWREAHDRGAPAGEAPPAGAARRPWYALAAENTETVCAGVIAGGALMGIGLSVLGVLVLPDVHELTSFGKALSDALIHAPK
jgi:uncharacterized oligopeptide transporter (OPT) family protein